jgi:hypothetical protein
MTFAESQPPPSATSREGAALASAGPRERLAALLGRLLARVWCQRRVRPRIGSGAKKGDLLPEP